MSLAFIESLVEHAALAWLEPSGGRDTLLPKLISGGLRIEDAEKFIRKAV
ncbi:MAG: hypothetical protein H7A11_05980 [Pseudomonadales bacterium]|nr:hypothetical protein [Pseudomonadales bacterium]